MSGPTNDVEAAILALLDSGAHDAALTRVIEAYGPEILGFLTVRLGSREHAREAFSCVTEDLWRGLPSFSRRSMVRTWTYAVARNAAHRYAKRELRVRFQGVPVSQVSQASALAAAFETSPGLDLRVARIRAQLSADEQTVLSLRVDKAMDWREIASIMLYTGEPAPSEAELQREVLRLRKRFQLIKDKLRKLASELSSH